MRARQVWFESPGVARVRHVELAAPGEGEALVRTIASGPSAGTERLVLLGRVPHDARAAMALPAMRGDFTLPISYGYAAVGVVEALGPGAIGPAPGTRVFALHPHHDRFVAPAASLRALPDDVPPARAVLAANLETAVNVVWDAEIALGDRVVVAGLGVVGLLVAHLAARAGASVAAIDPDPGRRALFAGLVPGTTAEPDARAAPLASADALIDCSGSAASLATLVAGAGREARVVAASWYGDAPVALSLGATFHPHRVTIRSSQVGAIAPARRGRWDLGRRFALVIDLLGDAALDALLAPAVPLDDAPRLYEELARGAIGCPPQRIFIHQ